jgi:hypothetical protein
VRTPIPGWRRVARRAGLGLALFATLYALLFVAATIYEARALSDRLTPDRYRLAESATDVTDRYIALMADADAAALAFARVQDRLYGVAVIFVPSFMGDQLAATQAMGLAPESQEPVLLRSLGLGVILPDIDTEAPSAVNGRVLADLIARQPRPVCVISHSKGGLDTLAALLLMDEETRRMVRCWIALQAPMGGTPTADLHARSPLLQALTDPVLRLLGGSSRSIAEMTTDARQRFLLENDAELRRLASSVPTLAVGTAANGPGVPSFMFAPFHGWMAGGGILNDGMVPTHSSVLPHAAYVSIAGMDHLSPFSDRQLQALFALALESGR